MAKQLITLIHTPRNGWDMTGPTGETLMSSQFNTPQVRKAFALAAISLAQSMDAEVYCRGSREGSVLSMTEWLYKGAKSLGLECEKETETA